MKITIKISIAFILLVVVSHHSFAGAIGLTGTAKYGVATRIGIHNIHSIHGKTQDISAVQPYNFVVTDWLSNGLKYWVEIYHASYRFEPTQNNVGQQLKQTGTRLSVIKNVFFSRNLKPWLGMGVDSAYARFSKKHTIDFEGYRAQQFPNENKLDLGLLFHAHNTWDYSKDWSMGLKGEYRLSLSESLQSSTFEVFILYRSK